MIVGFEPRFAILNGFNFEDEKSRTHAVLAALWLREANNATDKPYRAPLIIINGPRIERARLARRLCKVAGAYYEHSRVWPPQEDDFDRHLWQGTPAYICEELSRAARADQRRLRACAVLSSQYFKPKRALQSAPEKPLRTLVIVAASDELELSADLARRSVVIRLGKSTAKK